MKNTTFKNDEVINGLNQKFYFISLDVEEKQDIRFRGHTFTYKPTGANTGVNELAEQLGTINGELSYPAICFLNAEYKIINQQEGYLAAKGFLSILNKLTAEQEYLNKFISILRVKIRRYTSNELRQW